VFSESPLAGDVDESTPAPVLGGGSPGGGTQRHDSEQRGRHGGGGADSCSQRDEDDACGRGGEDRCPSPPRQPAARPGEFVVRGRGHGPSIAPDDGVRIRWDPASRLRETT